MIDSVLAVAAVALGLATVGLLAAGARWKRAGWQRVLVSMAAVLGLALAIAEVLWNLPSSHTVLPASILAVAITAVAYLKRDWNPIAQIFLATLLVTSAAFLAAAAEVTFAGGLPIFALIGSVVLTGLEAFAFLLLAIGTHEVLDVVGRVRWNRRVAGSPGGYEPFVSIHVAAHNEPPELVLQTLRSLSELDYDNYEVIVLDNNTDDPALWQPLEGYCREFGFRFVHLADWPGYKSGALNYGLQVTDECAEVIAVVDSDFVVEPDFLRATVGHFIDPSIGIVQTAQSFRTDHDHDYLHKLALTYRTFDEVTMPSRNERDAIIFAGTMGLLRRKALIEAGGWAEWCVTEDAELSLRIISRGYKTLYVERSFGRGVMPLTFAALKRQRFRWCFGGVQILRRHWKLMLTGRGRASDGTALSLTRGQRYEYLAAALQWFQALLTVIFSALLLVASASKLLSLPFELRPLTGLFIAVPALLLFSGLTKSAWGLRARLRVSWLDVVSVVGIWLSLTWAVALGCLQAISGRDLPFFRTPKFHEHQSIRETLGATRVETPFAIALFAAAGALASARSLSPENVFLVSLAAWGGIVFGTAPAVAFIAARSPLTSRVLVRRRLLESVRGRSYGRPAAFGLGLAAASLAALIALGGTSTVTPEGAGLEDLFTLPDDDIVRREAVAEGPAAEAGIPTQPAGVTPGGFDANPAGSGPVRGGAGSVPGQAGLAPGAAPSEIPAAQPTQAPASQPTQAPAAQPTQAPAAQPDQKPSEPPAPAEPSQKPEGAPAGGQP